MEISPTAQCGRTAKLGLLNKCLVNVSIRGGFNVQRSGLPARKGAASLHVLRLTQSSAFGN